MTFSHPDVIDIRSDAQDLLDRTESKSINMPCPYTVRYLVCISDDISWLKIYDC